MMFREEIEYSWLKQNFRQIGFYLSRSPADNAGRYYFIILKH